MGFSTSLFDKSQRLVHVCSQSREDLPFDAEFPNRNVLVADLWDGPMVANVEELRGG
jgi:hypothetical protein